MTAKKKKHWTQTEEGKAKIAAKVAQRRGDFTAAGEPANRPPNQGTESEAQARLRYELQDLQNRAAMRKTRNVSLRFNDFAVDVHFD